MGCGGRRPQGVTAGISRSQRVRYVDVGLAIDGARGPVRHLPTKKLHPRNPTRVTADRPCRLDGHDVTRTSPNASEGTCMEKAGTYRLRISVENPDALAPAAREALDALAAALAVDESNDDVSGFAARTQVEIGSLSPRPGAFQLPNQSQTSGLVCLGFSWPSDGGDPSCGVFW